MLYNTWCKFYFTMSITTATASFEEKREELERITSTLADLLKSYSFQFRGALTLNTGDHVFIISVTENVPTLKVYNKNRSLR